MRLSSSSSFSVNRVINSCLSQSVDFGFGSYHFEAQSTNVIGTVQAFYVYLNDSNEVSLNKRSLDQSLGCVLIAPFLRSTLNMLAPTAPTRTCNFLSSLRRFYPMAKQAIRPFKKCIHLSTCPWWAIHYKWVLRLFSALKKMSPQCVVGISSLQFRVECIQHWIRSWR